MLAQIEPTRNDFFDLARYFVQGKTRPAHPDRVAWSFAHNLFTDDPELVAKLMTATAALSKRCTNACYHLSINWRDDETPTPEIMQEVARRTLEMAGLGEHQAFVMGHGDTPHRHLHMMINRVHPETGRAWSTSHDYRRFDAIMRQLSEEYRFQHVPCHAFDPETTDALPRKPNSAANYAARRGADTARPQWSARDARSYAGRISERLDRASSWDDLHALFAEDGLALEAKGKGHVVGNATSYVKLSALGLHRTANGFEKRRPPRRRPRQGLSVRPIMDEVDVAKGLALFGLVDGEAVRDAVREAHGRRLAWLAGRPLIDQLLDDLGKTLAAWTALTPPKRPPRSTPGRRRSRARGSGRDR